MDNSISSASPGSFASPGPAAGDSIPSDSKGTVATTYNAVISRILCTIALPGCRILHPAEHAAGADDDRSVWPILYRVRFASNGSRPLVGGGMLGDDDLSDSERRRLAEIESSLR